MGSTEIETTTSDQLATFVIPSRPRASWIASGVVTADLDPTYQGMGLPVTTFAGGTAVRRGTVSHSGKTSWSPPV